jgi:hypothetical protein
MGRPPIRHYQPESLRFWKALGVGGKGGFSILPDFSTYCLLTVFDDTAAAEAFLESETVKFYTTTASDFKHYLLHNIQSHGLWGGQNPFQTGVTLTANEPVAIITRATIKPHLALKFWMNVPDAAQSMAQHDGQILSKGIGEWPIFMQATFSIWQNIDSMKAYAYQNQSHKTMIKKTKEIGWYSEELFARFHLIRQITK